MQQSKEVKPGNDHKFLPKLWYWFWNIAALLITSMVITLYSSMFCGLVLNCSAITSTLIAIIIGILLALFSIAWSIKIVIANYTSSPIPKWLTIFRSAIIAYAILTIAAFLIDWFFPHLYVPKQGIIYQHWASAHSLSLNAFVTVALAFYIPFIMINAVTLLGIFYFKRGLRYIFTITAIIPIMLNHTDGMPTLYGGLYSTLNELSLIMLGVVITLMFATPVKKYLIREKQ